MTQSPALQSQAMSDASAAWTIRRLLEWTTGFFTRKGVDAPRLSAELLLGHVLNLARIRLYTEYEKIVSDKDLATFRGLVQRAADQEPIAYLTGKAHFFNLELEVTRDVLIPRADTETLVENVLQLARNQAGFAAPRILDLCTGSGCIAAALAQHLKNAVIVAIDISPKAVAVAQRNIEKHKLAERVALKEGDLFEPLSTMVDVQPFDLIVSNPPYIPTDQIRSLDRSVRDFEPREALEGGLDGLMMHRRILEHAPAHLSPGGRIFLEIAFDQADAARQITSQCPTFEDVRILKDYSGHDRVLTAVRKK